MADAGYDTCEFVVFAAETESLHRAQSCREWHAGLIFETHVHCNPQYSRTLLE